VTTRPENDPATEKGSASPAERRRQPRFDVDVSVRLTSGGVSFAGLLCDICRDAAWVESQRSCALGEQVAMAVELPGTGGPMMIEGRVTRVAPGERAPNGMAILFSDLSPMVATRIDFFVALQGY
jgi:Tfp pilus assembly protein PilZ